MPIVSRDGEIDPVRVVLASASPRRRAMLEAAGVRAAHLAPDLDDADLPPRGAGARAWAMAMAWLKVSRVARLLAESCGPAPSTRPLLGADTVCELDGEIVGKPRDAEACRRLLGRMAGRSHLVHTGWCLLDPADGGRLLALDSAVVHVGPLDPETIDDYVAGGGWRDKAGGYSFQERLEAGWPLRCDGDPATVMGLPMRRLAPILARLARGEPFAPRRRRRADGAPRGDR